LEQGQIDWRETAAQAKARLGNSNDASEARQPRDLALFNLAIDSKLRGCDVVAVKVDDVAPNGYAVERATVRQRKTGRPVRFELTEQTRHATDEESRFASRLNRSFATQSEIEPASRN
jgi:hypothetical protein